jgi:hypothetical protein
MTQLVSLLNGIFETHLKVKNCYAKDAQNLSVSTQDVVSLVSSIGVLFQGSRSD